MANFELLVTLMRQIGVRVNIKLSFSFNVQIVGTSKNFQKRKRHSPEKKRGPVPASAISDSEDSYSSSSRHGGGRHKSPNNKVQSFTPSTPPPTAASYRTTKRRKGIPHRAPMGGLVIEY